MKRIRLLLIEDSRLLREGLVAALKKQRDIKIVAASGKSENTVLKIHQLKPNVILLDLGLRSLNSLHVVEMVKKESREAKVIVMDLAPVQGDIMQFVKAGAAGFILKDATIDKFLTTIRAVAEGARVLPPHLPESIFSQIVEHAVKGGKTKFKKALRMTSREREIVRLIGESLSDKEIGRRLHVSTHTIKSHVHNIMEKLALHTRLEVANIAYTDGPFRTSGRSENALGH